MKIEPNKKDMKEFNPDFSALRHNNFEEYGRFQQHLILLEDQERIETYHKAILDTTPGGVIVDIGSGTGILSLMALKSGYEYAVLVEPSKKISSYSAYLLEKNGFNGKYEIINSNLESTPLTKFPTQIDLLISETISSLIVGFGSWNYINKLKSKLSRDGSIIPNHGKLFAFLSSEDLATRNQNNTGLKYCSQVGLDIDLYYRTFRSGGNVFNKQHIYSNKNKFQVINILDFDFRTENIFKFHEINLVLKENEKYTGITFFWEIFLDVKENHGLSSLDPNLSSWNPFYVPFTETLDTTKYKSLELNLKLLELDAPYPFAFQLFNGSKELTNVLYW